MLLLQPLVYCFIREISSRNVFCVESIGQTEGCYAASTNLSLLLYKTNLFRNVFCVENIGQTEGCYAAFTKP